jgi:[CysO sulfur-carrier protein]-S-L-cysteine hydrolase
LLTAGAEEDTGLMNEPKLTRAIFDTIVVQAERDFPNETCGFIIGAVAAAEGKQLDAQEVRPITNIQNSRHAEDPQKFARDARTAFLMDPKELLAVLNELDRRSLSLIAVYHSHPDHDAYFSATDRAQACLFDPAEPDYPDTFHIVLSVRGGRFVRAAAFIWDPSMKDFVERELIVI